MSIRELIVYLRARKAADAIVFYQQAFGATETLRLVEPGGRIGHAELMFGDIAVYISDEFPEMDVLAPAPGAAPPFIIHLHVDDADAAIAKAVAAGATVMRAAEDQFYGERSGAVRDPFGYDWLIGHAIEEVTPAEMQARYDALFDTPDSTN